MKKILTVIAAAGALVIASAAPQDASARPRGGAVAAGVLGGLAAGAIIGGAIASSPRAYGYSGYAPVTGYEPYGAYGGRAPVGCPGGYWARRPVHDRWGNHVGWSRPRYFCPAY